MNFKLNLIAGLVGLRGNGRWHYGPLGCALLVCGLLGCRSETPPPAVNAARGTVTMEIKRDDDVQTIHINDVADGETLEAVLRQVSAIEISLRGSGTTAFVHSIGKRSTSAAEGWIFKIDGQWSAAGVGTTVLHPPTTVTWEYGKWDSKSP